MILDRSELKCILGIADTIDNKTLGLVNFLHPLAERAVKLLTRCNLESQVWTHYLPVRENIPPRDPFLDIPFDVQGNQAVQLTGRYVTGDRLSLPEVPVRSVSRVSIDLVAWDGQAQNPFPASGDLVQGVNYFIDFRQYGFSKTGQLVRIASAWPQVPGSVLVTYTAGYTRAELDGNATSTTDPTGAPVPPVNACELKQAVSMTFMAAYGHALASRKGAAGPISRERLGNYSVEYDTQTAPVASGFQVTVPPAAQELLQPYINYARILAN